MKGIDVSNHNGDINWSLVKNDGVDVVYIKATEGTTYEDPRFEKHYKGAKEVGLKTGFYHFLVGSSEPETQAENFYNHIKDKENNLLPCLDIEHSRNEPKDYMDFALRFIKKFRELSTMAIAIYSGPHFINEYLDNRLAKYPLWVAHYGVDNPMSNNVWGNSYAGHQYTETGSVQGITGNVDINRFTSDILNAGEDLPTVDEPEVEVPEVDDAKKIYMELQKELNRQGYKDKNGNRLAEDGIPGKLTLSACPTIKRGARGKLTAWIQSRIGVKADEIFGEDTENAVIAYQKKHELTQDGIVGKDTWSKLLSL